MSKRVPMCLIYLNIILCDRSLNHHKKREVLTDVEFFSLFDEEIVIPYREQISTVQFETAYFWLENPC